MKKLSIAVAGSTGLVGSTTISHLSANPNVEKIFALNRKLERVDENVHWQKASFENLDESVTGITHVDIAICALGTTIKTAGSQEAFRKVDVEFPVSFGKWAKSLQAKKYILISSIGSDTESMFFYSRCKGEVENLIKELNFESTIILRPSTLLGDRGEFRIGEEIAKFFSPITPKSFAPVHAKSIAEEIERWVFSAESGIQIVESKEIGG